MKVNYFGYHLRNSNTGKKLLFDMVSFLNLYAKYGSPKLKNNFQSNGEKLFLLPYEKDTYLFLITRNNELIRKVKTSDISVNEIDELLAEDEHLGFASYILFKPYVYGFGSTVLAPKADIFAKYISDLLSAIGLSQWTFIPQALLHKATKEEALSYIHIGKTTIQISKENTVFQDILDTVNVNTEDTFDLEGLEITIKPKKKKNIKPVVDQVINSLSEKGVEKIVMRAKSENASQMADLYMVGKGAISDYVDTSKEKRIPELLEKRFSSNERLGIKIQEFKNNEEFQKDVPESLLRWCDTSTWSTPLPDLQYDGVLQSSAITEPS